MRMEFKFDDGLIEMRDGDAYGGPDNCFSRMNVNSSAMFIRKDGGDWLRSDHRSGHNCKKFIESCSSASEVMRGVTNGFAR